ncbi:MAG: glycoside hydrolase family 27 protein [Bacteroidales bacterium]|nr:glycoside hydrolase family 27 protein [Bacteroidales bacterium]
MAKKILCFIVYFISLSISAYCQKNEHLALTPPMGWNSWNTFSSEINEQLIKDMADKLVASGMKNAGYEYIVIDDCWLSHERDSIGNLQADPIKFPYGMKAVGDYIHSKGLKFGMYNCAGTMTCAGYPGTYGHEYQDALSYAKWGVDYLKYDWCYTDGINAKEAYTTMSKALTATGRPIVFSICEWGTSMPWKWAAPVGHLWRTTGDISCSWVEKKMSENWIPLGITKIIDIEANLREYAGPGHWNDPDMLEVGNGLSYNEDKAHFTMWAMLAAPLIAGNDLRKMSKQTLDILTNSNVIAIDQDSLGIQALRYMVKDSVEIWVKPLVGGNWAFCFFNRSEKKQKINFDFASHIINDTLSHRILNTNILKYKIYDLWERKKMGYTNKMLKYDIPSHNVLLLRLSPNKFTE